MNDDEKEVLKAGAEAALRPIADIIENLFGGPAEQIGGMWTDALAARRQIRGIALAKKVQAAYDKAGFEPQRIPDDILIPALREAVLQDDESLQEKWANLLANAGDPRQINPVRPSFSQILKEFTPLDASFLDALYAVRDPLFPPRMTARDLLVTYCNVSLDRRLNDSKRTADEVERVYESDDLATAIDILLRNRILEGSTTPDGIAMSKVVSDSNVVDLPPSIRAIRPVREWLPEIVATSYHLTALGIAFVKACQAPPSVESH